jgi:hypothetical protein
MKKKINLKDDFKQYNGHIVSEKTGLIMNFFFNTNILNDIILCKSFLISKKDNEDEIFSLDKKSLSELNKDDFNKKESLITCEKCKENYFKIIEEYKTFSATQRLVIMVGRHLLKMDVIAEQLASNPKLGLETFKRFEEEKRLKEIDEREERLMNKMIKTRKK